MCIRDSTYAEVINYAADTQRYETLITVDSYRIGPDEFGNYGEVLVDSSTKFLGRFEQSIIN